MHVTIREFGYLSASGTNDGLDFQVLPEQAFRELRRQTLQQADGARPLCRLTSRGGRECLQVLNFVGLLQTKSGCRVEILPKTSLGRETELEARKLLWKMLSEVYKVKAVQHQDANLATLQRDWLELLITYALLEISMLVRKGICRDYKRFSEQSRFLKGQLQVSQQLRLRPGQQDRFHVRYDRYLPDRPENRLLKSAVVQLEKWARSIENQRVCRELLFVLEPIPPSADFNSDLSQWSRTRELAHYAPVEPWVRLILAEQAPVFSPDKWHGISLLFPMESLYEEYVTRLLSRQLAVCYRLREQVKSESLVTHLQRKWFRLIPDQLIDYGKTHSAVLDTKWKLIDGAKATTSDKYNISQSDMYQLFAYGKKYLGGEGHVFLIYPYHDRFTAPLPVFEFDDRLSLWVVPFNFGTDRLIGGSWEAFAPWLAKAMQVGEVA